MTSIAEASSTATYNMPFDKGIFSDPTMRPYLEDYYESLYAPMRERIADMKEAEANGEGPRTVKMRDGTTATELSAAQYEAAIPTFDKWLELQQNFSIFDIVDQSTASVEHAQAMLERSERALNPDLPSGVRTVFSDGKQILGYITEDGGMVNHGGGAALQKIAEKANDMNLTGEARIAYMTAQGAAELSRQYPNLKVAEYTKATMPTRREFSQAWYPDNDVDGRYESAMQEMKAFLEEREAWQAQQMQNLNAMRAFLIQVQSVDEAAAA